MPGRTAGAAKDAETSRHSRFDDQSWSIAPSAAPSVFASDADVFKGQPLRVASGFLHDSPQLGSINQNPTTKTNALKAPGFDVPPQGAS
jgi:hypothetical protein